MSEAVGWWTPEWARMCPENQPIMHWPSLAASTYSMFDPTTCGVLHEITSHCNPDPK